jgi:hypothetical protein
MAKIIPSQILTITIFNNKLSDHDKHHLIHRHTMLNNIRKRTILYARVTWGVGKREQEAGSWELEVGSWKKGDGRSEMEEGRWKKGDGRREMEEGRWKKGDGRREMEEGSWKLGDGSWELGVGKRSL